MIIWTALCESDRMLFMNTLDFSHYRISLSKYYKFKKFVSQVGQNSKIVPLEQIFGDL